MSDLTDFLNGACVITYDCFWHNIWFTINGVNYGLTQKLYHNDVCIIDGKIKRRDIDGTIIDFNDFDDSDESNFYYSADESDQ